MNERNKHTNINSYIGIESSAMTLFTSSADEKIQGQDHLRECNNATPIAQYMVKEIITKMKDIQLFVCMCIYVKKANRHDTGVETLSDDYC